MKKTRLLPSAITAFGLSCGLFVIFKLAMTPVGEADYLLLLATAGILLLAAFSDFLDGAVARAIHAESAFGSLFDSLADAISFGVAPSVVVLKTLSIPSGTLLSFLITTAAMVFSMCGILRLVRYNAEQTHERKEELSLLGNGSTNFTGLPIPAAAAAVIATNLFLISPKVHDRFFPSEELRASVLLLVMTLLGYLMVSRWKFISFKTLRFRITSFSWMVATVLASALLLWGLIHHFSILFALIAWAYILIAWSLSLIRWIVGRRAKGLENFAPEEEEERWQNEEPPE